MSNKSSGNDYEIQFSRALKSKGFWVHRLNPNAAGQPADIIAVKDGIASLIDCKVCSKGYFELSRIEDNQELAMAMWKNAGNGTAWFALKFGNETCLVSMDTLLCLKGQTSKINETEAKNIGLSVGEWIERYKRIE